MRILGKCALLVMLIGLLALATAGCETTFPEWGGKMPNESSDQHVQPYNPEQQPGADSIRLAAGGASRSISPSIEAGRR